MELEVNEIREQLDRLLTNPLFRNSKRYPALLRHVVEKTLEGESGQLKERNLGVDVFGRDANYDTNSDPIVRMTAGEIRKRIAQYYHEPGRDLEIRIDLPSGSYVPEFHSPQALAPPVSVPVVVPVVSSRTRVRRTWALVAGLLVLAAVVVLGMRWWKPERGIDRFWEPVTSSSAPVLVCVGQRQFLATQQETKAYSNPDMARIDGPAESRNTPVSLFKLYYLGSQNVALSDVIALNGITSWLVSKGKPCHIRGKSTTTFDDVRSGPVILVGAFNNDWTIRLTGQLRFWYERENERFLITDHQKPGRNWSVSYDVPYLKLTEDYALISRVWDPTTERPVVVVGGLTGFGTMAASEFVTNPEYLEALASRIQVGKKKTNMQVVVATRVIDGHSGPPRIVDSYFW